MVLEVTPVACRDAPYQRSPKDSFRQGFTYIRVSWIGKLPHHLQSGAKAAGQFPRSPLLGNWVKTISFRTIRCTERKAWLFPDFEFAQKGSNTFLTQGC